MERRWVLVLFTILLADFVARADPGDDRYIRIARLSYISGHVSFQNASSVDWSAASINMPLEPEDRIYTGRGGRAEIEFEEGSVLRMSENTDMEILSLTEDLIQVRLLVGLLTLTASSGSEFEINTPGAAFNARRSGVYRFRVTEDGETEAGVRKGLLEAANNEFSRRIESGEMLRVAPGKDSTAHLVRYQKRDEWDEWNDRRDADRKAYNSRRYLPGSVHVGVADLDRYGRWVHIETYGFAWVPFSVGIYWAPYTVGRWCYRPLFGWTWISYEPWGWLPYHYGRWYRSPVFGWCWVPGPGFSFNFWSPGLVAFYRGPGWVSWIPLGPGDYYDVRRYHYNRAIYNYQLARLRALHTRAPGDLFNRNVSGSFHTVHLNHFHDGSPGDRNLRLIHITHPWREGSLIGWQPEIQPSAASFKPAPDGLVVRPIWTNPYPSVVRNHPGREPRGEARLTKITNPQILSTPVPVQRRVGEGSSYTPGEGGNSGMRVIHFPRAERTDQNPPMTNRNILEPQSLKTLPSRQKQVELRRVDENPRVRERSLFGMPAGSSAGSGLGNSPRWTHRDAAPQVNTIPQPLAPGNTPLINRAPTFDGGPRSGIGNGEGNTNRGMVSPPEIRRSSIYHTPRRPSSIPQAPINGSGRSAGSLPSGGNGASFGTPSGASSGRVSAGRPQGVGARRMHSH